MGVSWEESYVGQLRTMVGHSKLIVPSIRAVIINDKQEVLLIRRGDEGSWAMPAGSMELDESLFDCLKREVQEETGLDVLKAVPVALYSNPEWGTKNRFGDEYQLFEFLFKVEAWTGALLTETDETMDARFFALDDMPDLGEGFWREHHERVLADVKTFTGGLILR